MYVHLGLDPISTVLLLYTNMPPGYIHTHPNPTYSTTVLHQSIDSLGKHYFKKKNRIL